VEELCTKGICVNTFILSDEILVKRAWIDSRSKDSTNLRNIFHMLNKHYKTDLVYDCDNDDKLITFLRHVFLYCYYCARVFDTEIEMIRKCGDYHVRDGRVQRRVFDRKQKIITMERNFNYLKTDSPETELEKYVVRLADGVFRCDLCHKTFEQLVYVKKHIKNKHEELYSDVEQEIERFNCFLDMIDINLLNYFDGIDNNYLPTFCVYEEEGNAVKYDLKRLFSGDIKISK
ncbi:C2H2 Zn-finger protein, partial [Trachipleistophora hominis]